MLPTLHFKKNVIPKAISICFTADGLFSYHNNDQEGKAWFKYFYIDLQTESKKLSAMKNIGTKWFYWE